MCRCILYRFRSLLLSVRYGISDLFKDSVFAGSSKQTPDIVPQ